MGSSLKLWQNSVRVLHVNPQAEHTVLGITVILKQENIFLPSVFSLDAYCS